MRSPACRLLLPLLLAAAGPATAQAPAPAPSVLAGELLSADGGSTASVRLTLHAAAQVLVVTADSTGRFSLPLPDSAAGLWPDDTLEVSVAVDEATGAAARGAYLPARVRLARSELDEPLRLVLIPREWRIVAGSFAGARVPIDLRRAFALDCRGCPSFYRRPLAAAPSAAARRTEEPSPHGWPGDVFPLRVAFDREYSLGRIGARDSLGFWRVTDALEAALGLDLFRPVSFAEAMDEETPDNALLVWVDPALRAAGLGTLFSYGGRVVYGSVRLQRMAMVEEWGGAVLMHELLHTLGFGHTCGWRSLMAEAGCGSRAEALTAADVAYAQLGLRLRALQQRQRAHGLAAALRALEAPAATTAPLAGAATPPPAPPPPRPGSAPAAPSAPGPAP